MKSTILISIILFLSINIYSQGFNVDAGGEQTFYFDEKITQNQATFFSTTPLEDINGLTKEIGGKVTFDVNDFKTLKGEIKLPVASLRTGIRQMEKDLRSSSWLNEEKYPQILFKIKSVTDIQKLGHNKLKAKVIGDFTVHGVTNEETAEVTVTYLKESEKTKERMPGDLLGVEADFSIVLKNYGVKHMLMGQRVADKIEIKANLIGSNKF